MDMPGAGDVLIERDLIVRARDGVGLATDVYRPPGRGPFPVLLENFSPGTMGRLGGAVPG